MVRLYGWFHLGLEFGLNPNLYPRQYPDSNELPDLCLLRLTVTT